MPQRSFRLAETALADLQTVAEYLTSLDPTRKPPNQTTALAWCIARGIEAVESAQAKASKASRDLNAVTHELRQVQAQLGALADAVSQDRRARENERMELERHRKRVPALEELVSRRDAGGRWAEVDDHGAVWTCEGSPENVTKTREARTLRVNVTSSPLPAAPVSGSGEPGGAGSKRVIATHMEPPKPVSGDGVRVAPGD